jgi:WhiB family redox-sensing transcriptional regulator
MTNHGHSKQVHKLYVELIVGLQENEGAVCEQVPETFFPAGLDMRMVEEEIKLAKKICQDCPLIVKCAEYAIVAEEPFGIWGGLTPIDRNIIRRRKI